MPLRQHAPQIYSWSRFQPERGYDFNGTAVVEGQTVLLIDPVPSSDETLAALQRLGSTFEIVLLNGDHERDATAFQSRFNAPIRIAAPDAFRLKQSNVIPFNTGDVLAGGWQARILANMKTPGEAVLYHPQRRVVIAGDALIGDPITGLRFVPPAKLPNQAGAIESLRALAQLDFDALILGDGFSLPSGGKEALVRFLSSRS